SSTMRRHLGIIGLISCFRSPAVSLTTLPWHFTSVVSPDSSTSYPKGIDDGVATVASSHRKRSILQYFGNWSKVLSCRPGRNDLVLGGFLGRPSWQRPSASAHVCPSSGPGG